MITPDATEHAIRVDLHPVTHDRTAAPVARSDRVIAIAGMFGLELETDRPPATASGSANVHDEAPAPIELAWSSGDIVFITGHSGSGKTSVLACIKAQLDAMNDVTCVSTIMRGEDDNDERASTTQAVIDTLGSDLNAATSALARAGLADAHLMIRSVDVLSAGEYARLLLARTIATVADQPRPCVVLIDEFGTLLDRGTAFGLARRLARWVRSARGVSLVVATAHHDVLESLDPDVLVLLSVDGTPRVIRAEANASCA